MNAESAGENEIRLGAKLNLRSAGAGLQARLPDFELPAIGRRDSEPGDADAGPRRIERLGRRGRWTGRGEGGEEQCEAQAPVHSASVPRIDPAGNAGAPF